MTNSILEALYTLGEAQEFPLPSGRKATVREMTGLEQRAFSNKAKMSTGESIQELLMACVVTLDGEMLPSNKQAREQAITDMLSGDREALTFYIRKVSLGDSFTFKAKCPAQGCNHAGEYEVDLANPDFTLTPYLHGTEKVITFNSQLLPDTQFRYTHLDGHSELHLIRNRNKFNATSDLEARRIKTYDAANDKWLDVDVARLPDRIIKEIRAHVRSTEGSLDTKVVVTCAACAQELTFNLLMLPDFMIPSGTF